MEYTRYYTILIDYLPVILLAIGAGIAGYLQEEKEVSIDNILRRAISSAALGIGLLLISDEFFHFGTRTQYGIIFLIIYFSPEKILGWAERLLRMRH